MFNRWGRTPLQVRFAAIVPVLVLSVLLAGCGSTSHTAASSAPYYVALGDSLAVGIQPTSSGQQLETDDGYVNDLDAHLKLQLPELKLVELGCPGDSTSNMLTGQGNAVAAKFYNCDRTGGSQLRAGLAVIRAHRSQVKVVSIDIGANDVIACISSAVFSKGAAYTLACVDRGEASIAADLPKILGPLKAAAAPGTVLVGGTVYDPYLAGLVDENPSIRTIATDSLEVITKADQEITGADTAAGFKTANVAGAFSTHDSAEVRSATLKTKVPKAVAVLCAFTYMCASAPQGPNIHPTTAGYSAMAGAYERQMGSL